MRFAAVYIALVELHGLQEEFGLVSFLPVVNIEATVKGCILLAGIVTGNIEAVVGIEINIFDGIQLFGVFWG